MKRSITIVIDTKNLNHLTSFELASAYAEADMEFKETSSKQSKRLKEEIGKHIITRWMERKLPLMSEIHRRYHPEFYKNFK